MKLVLNYGQWKWLKEIIKMAELMEMKTTTGTIRLADQSSQIEIYEDITIEIPDEYDL